MNKLMVTSRKRIVTSRNTRIDHYRSLTSDAGSQAEALDATPPMFEL